MNKRQKIESQFTDLISKHEEAIKRVEEIPFKHKGSLKLQEANRDNLIWLLNEIVKEYETVRDQIVWDHLVVGLFGPTNAGKSTIIEALRLKYSPGKHEWVHGEIVGTGEADFTKDAAEYDICINGHRVTLIDIPGIEGDESKYSEIIRKALRKAHFVLYVHNQDKTPDAATTKKIVNYLANWTRVISIYNVTNSVSNYADVDDRVSFLTPKLINNGEKIKSAFGRILGDLYDGNITLQAQLALCANSDFEDRKDLKRNADKVQRYFGDREAAYEFSNMSALCNLLEEKSHSFADIIYKSQQQKIKALKETSVSLVKALLDEQESEIRTLKNRLTDLRSDVRTYFTETQNAIESQIKLAIRQAFTRVRTSGNEIIKNSDSDSISRKLKSPLRELPLTINNQALKVVNKQIQQLEDSMTGRFNEFDHISLTFPKTVITIKVSVDVDVDDVVDNVKFGFGDVMDVASGAASGAWFGPWGAVAGVGIVLLGKAILGDGGKGKAQEAWRKELDVCQEETIDSLSTSSRNMATKLDSTKKKIVSDITKEINNLNDLIIYSDTLLKQNED